MVVYVVMGNDFPDAVFTSQTAADAYCDEKRSEETKRTYARRRIYWRSCPFTLDRGVER